MSSSLKCQYQKNQSSNVKQLFKEIQQQGYSGTYETVACYTHTLRSAQSQPSPNPDSLKDLPGRGPAPKVTIKPQKPLKCQACGLVSASVSEPQNSSALRKLHDTDGWVDEPFSSTHPHPKR